MMLIRLWIRLISWILRIRRLVKWRRCTWVLLGKVRRIGMVLWLRMCWRGRKLIKHLISLCHRRRMLGCWFFRIKLRRLILIRCIFWKIGSEIFSIFLVCKFELNSENINNKINHSLCSLLPKALMDASKEKKAPALTKMARINVTPSPL